MYLDYGICVSIILKQNNMFYFLNWKIIKTVEFEFKILITRSNNFLNDINDKWSKGKHSQSTTKDTTKEKPLRLLNSEEFQKVVLHNSA